MQSQPVPSHQPTQYFSYLIRIWQECPGAAWRVSAQSVQSGKTMHFATIDALSAFLHEHNASAEDDNSASNAQNFQKGNPA